MHARRIKFHDAILVGKSSVADTDIVRVIFDYVDACDDTVKRVGTAVDHLDGFGHRRQSVGAGDGNGSGGNACGGRRGF